MTTVQVQVTMAPPMKLSILSFLILLQSSCPSIAVVQGAAAASLLPHHQGVHRKVKVPFSLRLSSSILSTRGGDDSNDEKENEDDEDFDDDDDFALDVDSFDTAEDDFQEESSVGRMVDAWHKTPPLTKLYLSASFIATMTGYLSNPNHSFPAILQLDWQKTFRKMQLWRPLTAFLNVGNFGLAYVMTAHFLWTYMSTLERLNHHAPYDFWIMMGFGMTSMVVGYGMFRLSPRFLGHNLSTFLVYVWSRYHEGLEVNMFEMFNARAELLPWFFLAQTFLLEGEVPLLDFLGIVFGHVYHHCKTVGLLRAPDALVAWYHGPGGAGIRKKYKHISADFEMAA